MVLLSGYAFVWSIIPGMLCRWSSFRVRPSTEHLRANASHKNISLKDHLQNTPGLMLRYVFVWSISSEVFCRWSSFHAMFLCGLLDQGCCVGGRTNYRTPRANAPHKNITLKEDQLQNTSGLMLHTDIILKEDHPRNISVLIFLLAISK
jgi:hypothetical protein